MSPDHEVDFLVDTSAWVEFDRATGSAIDRLLTVLIETDARVAVTVLVIIEVTAGARSDAREGESVPAPSPAPVPSPALSTR